MRGEEGNPFLQYDMADRAQESKYPYWVDSAPNLQTFLTAINKSQPIIGCQFEMVWSRWPRTLFFAKKITIPGVTVQTQDLAHAGFTIKIPTHATYESTEITLTIIADKEGFHYYDLRNMVIQTGHPLVAGDPKATIGNPFGISPTEDTIEVRLRNRPEDETHHHWIIHNFHPTGIGDMELGHDSTGFVEFDLTGTFTHITYDAGEASSPTPPSPPPSQSEATDAQETNQREEPEEPEEPDDEEEEEESEEPEEPEDLRPPEPPPGPEPSPEPEPPKTTSIVSASDKYSTDGDSESQTSSVSEVKMEEPVSDQDMKAAEQCNEELTEASDELEQELERIKNMPADPNYPPEQVTEDLYNNVHTPNANQQDVPEDSDEEYKGDKVTAVFSTDVTIKSPEQKAAYDAAVAKYNQKTQASMNKYKDARRQQNQQSGR